MHRILVGVDGSPSAQAALEWAARTAKGLGVELVLAEAWTPAQAEVAPATYELAKAEAAAQLAGPWCRPAIAAGASVRSRLLEGHPGDVLLEAADEEGADLLVVGTRGRGGFAGLRVGSVAHHLAHHTRRPLAIVAGTNSDRSVERIVVGVDGSRDSLAAIDWTAALAAGLGATVTAVLVFEPLAEWVPRSDPRSWRRVAESDLASWTKPLADAGVLSESTIVEDLHPVPALCRVADSHDADLVVVGAKGLGGFVGMRLGRIPLQLLHHAGRPVALVPEGEASA